MPSLARCVRGAAGIGVTSKDRGCRFANMGLGVKGHIFVVRHRDVVDRVPNEQNVPRGIRPPRTETRSGPACSGNIQAFMNYCE